MPICITCQNEIRKTVKIEDVLILSKLDKVLTGLSDKSISGYRGEWLCIRTVKALEL